MQKFSKTIVALMLTVALCSSVGCKKYEGTNGTFKGHDYVDLGLPSGTLWATCNVGADSPDGYGDYFAWGETEPKTTYNWSTYLYSTVNWGEGWSTPTYKQWVELLTKCSYSWTTINGVKGCVFMARNGHSIFLPAGDSRFDEEGRSRDVGEIGSYWSSTLHQDMPDGVKGCQFIISFDDCDLYDTFCRANGRPVRAVCTSR